MSSDASTQRVVVVGGGHAAVDYIAGLRRAGHTGEIIVVSEEAEYPYHRPPLSKHFFEDDFAQTLRPAEFYAENGIQLRLGERVTAIDTDRQLLSTTRGQLDYDILVLATGSRPRSLTVPGADLDGIRSLRTLADAQTLREWLEQSRDLVVVGGGYIGLEVTAVMTAAGLNVTVVEREDRILARVASPQLSQIIADRHRAAGTTILTGADVAGFLGDGPRVRAVALRNGTALEAGAVLVGVGAVPNDEQAKAAGIACDGGIIVDEQARTSAENVLAIGDVTRRPVAGVEGVRRLESIPSAAEQARQAVATTIGLTVPLHETPWFWSDQFDLKLKMAGLLRPGLDVVLRGDPLAGRFALFHLDDGVPVAVESANATGEFAAARRWIQSRTRVDPLLLARTEISLREAAA